jgi:hypothetical protein
VLRSVPWFARVGAAVVLVAAVMGVAAADSSPRKSVKLPASSARAVIEPAVMRPTPPYVLLVLHRHRVKWGAPVFGRGAVIRYAFVDRWMKRPGAINCGTIGPIAGHLSRSSLVQSAFAIEIRRAMDEWQASVDVRFVPSDQASADLLIGVQKNPDGIAYTDIIPNPPAADGISAIRQAAICFNPTLPWESGFDGDRRTPDVRYVAAHELGHVLGLDHAWGADKLMDFNYREEVRTPQPDDIAGAAFLYGRAPDKNRNLVLKRSPVLPVSGVPGDARLR